MSVEATVQHTRYPTKYQQNTWRSGWSSDMWGGGQIGSSTIAGLKVDDVVLITVSCTVKSTASANTSSTGSINLVVAGAIVASAYIDMPVTEPPVPVSLQHVHRMTADGDLTFEMNLGAGEFSHAIQARSAKGIAVVVGRT